jgi:hypothetical protein
MGTEDELAAVGKPDQDRQSLKDELFDKREFDGLVRSALNRLTDAKRTELSLERRFDLAYNAAHALSLAALRRHGIELAIEFDSLVIGREKKPAYSRPASSANTLLFPGASLAFLHKRSLCRTSQRLPVFIDSLAFTRRRDSILAITLALFHERGFRGATERLTVFPDRLRFTTGRSLSRHGHCRCSSLGLSHPYRKQSCENYRENIFHHDAPSEVRHIASTG